MLIPFFIVLVALVALIYMLSAANKLSGDIEVHPKNISNGDEIYYYDRFWTVTAVRWDPTSDRDPMDAMVDGKDNDGNISSNIKVREIREIKKKG